MVMRTNICNEIKRMLFASDEGPAIVKLISKKIIKILAGSINQPTVEMYATAVKIYVKTVKIPTILLLGTM